MVDSARILIIDDVLATGGTAAATARLVWQDGVSRPTAWVAALQDAGASKVRINIRDAAVDAGAGLIQTWQDPQQQAVVQYWLPSANALFRAKADAAIAALNDATSPDEVPAAGARGRDGTVFWLDRAAAVHA